jgi:hypothetical protein
MKRLLALAVLSVSAFAAEVTPAPSPQAACGPESSLFQVKAVPDPKPAVQPEAGKSLVYVIEEYLRPPNELGKPTIRLGIDGNWVGANRSTSHFMLSVDPGEHRFCADWQGVPRGLGPQVSLMRLITQPGQTYYLRARVTEVSLRVWTLDLDPVNPDEGWLLVSRSPLSEFSPKK